MASKRNPATVSDNTDDNHVEAEAPAHASDLASVNRVILVGRLTRDPQFIRTATGIAKSLLRIATNARERAEYHDVVAWRQLAESAAQTLTKGQRVYVEGRLHGRTWESQDGVKHHSVEVVADTLRALQTKVDTPEA